MKKKLVTICVLVLFLIINLSSSSILNVKINNITINGAFDFVFKSKR